MMGFKVLIRRGNHRIGYCLSEQWWDLKYDIIRITIAAYGVLANNDGI